MRIRVRSTRLKGELKRRREEFSKVLSAALVVPDSMVWILMQEHGTGTHGRGKGEYSISPKNAPFLSWVSQVGKYAGKRIYRSIVEAHPGVPASHFIANSLEEIRSTVAAVLAEAMVRSNYNFEDVREALLSVGLVEVQRIIAEAISESLVGTIEDGKLAGQTAADAFNDNVQIQDRGEEG